jgi:hypothetical protein
MKRMQLYAKRKDGGSVEWQVFGLGGGWGIWGSFGNCVSRRCIVERVRRIVRAPREPPRRVFRMADVALDYLFGMINDVELDSYEVKLGINIGVADAYNRALSNIILARLAPGEKIEDRNSGEDDSGGFPELFITVSLTYDAYDCSNDKLCEGWWAEVRTKFDLESEWCIVSWSRFAGHDIDAVDRDAIKRVSYKALRRAYNMSFPTRRRRSIT